MDINASINATREGFEESFSSGDFYNKQTQNSEHLEQIMNFLPIRDGMKVLDLGAGSGYLSFPIAKLLDWILLQIRWRQIVSELRRKV